MPQKKLFPCKHIHPFFLNSGFYLRAKNCGFSSITGILKFLVAIEWNNFCPSGKNWVSCCQEAATLAVTTAIKAKIYCLYPSWQGFGRLWTTTQSLVTMINLKDLFNHLNEDSNVFYFFIFKKVSLSSGQINHSTLTKN